MQSIHISHFLNLLLCVNRKSNDAGIQGYKIAVRNKKKLDQAHATSEPSSLFLVASSLQFMQIVVENRGKLLVHVKDEGS